MQRSFIFQWSQLQRKLAGIDDTGRTLSGPSGWSPNADVCESQNGILVRLELAGVTPDCIEIQTTDALLIVRGARRDPQTSETAAGYRFRQMEIEFGPFERILALPFAVDGSSASATFNHGILSIRIPRAPKTTLSTRIVIRVNG